MPAPTGFIPPPGTVRIGENRFIDHRLITYEAYYECLDGLKRNQNPDAYARMIPADTSITYNGNRLWKNEKYWDYPIPGLTREQVETYCQWRSDAVNFMKQTRENRTCNNEYWNQLDAIDPDHAFRIVYKLPEEADLTLLKADKEKFWLAEYTEKGEFARPVSAKISKSDAKVFRCLAVYEKIQ